MGCAPRRWDSDGSDEGVTGGWCLERGKQPLKLAWRAGFKRWQWRLVASGVAGGQEGASVREEDEDKAGIYFSRPVRRGLHKACMHAALDFNYLDGPLSSHPP